MHPCGSNRAERGIALITALLLVLLLLSLSLGFTLLVSSEQGSNGVDLDRTQTFYAAYGAMEQINAAVGTLFQQSPAPTGADIVKYVLTTPDINGNAVPPSVPGMTFYEPYTGIACEVLPGYEVFYSGCPGNPVAKQALITVGPYQGFQGLVTNYTITISLQSQNYTLTTGTAGAGTINQFGSEVRLRRTLQTVAIPVFQFGIFSQTDLSFFPGPTFNFGGVVATNGTLYLASGSTLTLSSQTQAYGDIIRDRLSNGYTGGAYQGSYAGNVSVTTSPGTGVFRNLAFTEGSINGGPSNSGACPTNSFPGPPVVAAGTPNANWTTISVSDYNSSLRDGAYGCARGTGAKNLQLPLVQYGATAIDLIKLPFPNENTISASTAAIYCQRYAVDPATALCPGETGYAMVRILIADTVGDIMQIPEVSPTLPISMTAGQIPTFPPQPGVSPGYAKYLAPWAASAGGVSNSTAAPGNCPVLPAAQIYGGGCNYGDWFAAGLPRLGMGDGQSSPTYLVCQNNSALIPSPAPAAPSTCGPYIKIEYQDVGSGGAWTDVTVDILRLGYVGRNLSQGIGTPNDGTGAHKNVGATAGQIAAGAGAPGSGCYEPQPDAVIRLQRVTDTPSNYKAGAPNKNQCGYGATNLYAKFPAAPTGGAPIGPATGLSINGSDYIPLKLYDAREGLTRDCWTGGDCPAGITPTLAGVMNYVEIDVANLARWFSGSIGAKGAPPATTTGYLLYISDRRGNQVDSQNGSAETGANCGAGKCKLGNFGWEDFVNPASTNGVPNNVLDTGEDLHGANETAPGGPTVSLPLETYGGMPAYQPAQPLGAPYSLCTSLGTVGCPAGAATQLVPVAKLTNGAAVATGNAIYPQSGKTSPPSGINLTTQVSVNEARVNPPLFFRRAVKLTDAQSFAFTVCNPGSTCGLTITSENPVYVEGNYNAPGGSFAGADTPSAILADAVTLLSLNWNDLNSFNSPYADGGRGAATSFYRVAILGGKGLSFPKPTVGSVNQDFGTDGGVHNFLRYIENWGCCTLNYSGSLVSFFFNQQAVGTYKDGASAVYDPPNRGYNFDTNFLTPALLPPRTPKFRDINTLGFTQLIMPNQK